MGLKRHADGATLRRIEPREYPRDAAGLAAQLADADPAVRRWAARDLASHPQHATLLGARLAEEADASVRAVLFSSLGAIGGPAVVDAVLPLLRSEDPALRNGAIEVLAGLPADVGPRMQQLLQDADGDVRIFAVNLLGHLPHPQVPQWLAGVLQHEAAPNVVGAALDVLAEVGDASLVPALRAVRQRFADDPFIAFAAELAEQRCGAA